MDENIFSLYENLTVLTRGNHMQAVHLYPPSFSVYSLFSHVWKDAHIPIIMQVTRIKGSADKAEWEAQFILNLKVSSLVREQKKNSALVVQIVLEDHNEGSNVDLTITYY